jgi:hypothetical protein
MYHGMLLPEARSGSAQNQTFSKEITMRKSRLTSLSVLGAAAIITLLSVATSASANASTQKLSTASKGLPAADSVISHVVPGANSMSSYRSLERFWTPARMRAAAANDLTPGTTSNGSGEPATSPVPRFAHARPGILARPQAPQAPLARRGAHAGSNGDVSPSLAIPAAIGRVFFYDPALGGYASCSGATINNPEGDMVTTAGHCVNTGDNEWMQDWVYVPAYYYGNAPYGIWAEDELTSFYGWILGGNFNYDVGIANVYNPDNPFTLVENTGGNGLEWDETDCYCYAPDVAAWGYPAANGFNGEDAWYCLNSPTSILFSSYPQFPPVLTQLITPCAPLDNGGSSGGPWFAGFNTSTLLGYEDALTSTNVPGSPGTVGSPYFGSDIENIYDAAEYM